MTPQQIEALKLALEALEGFYEYGYDRQECFEHITAIKETLAEHAMREVQRLGQEIEQEPVAHWSDCAVHSEPAYPKGECDCGGIVAVADYTALADKYVALSDKYVALKAQRTEQEPVADYIAARDMLDAKPVPPRTWVGLTDEDMYVVSEEESCSFIAGAKWSEAILKEKNT